MQEEKILIVILSIAKNILYITLVILSISEESFTFHLRFFTFVQDDT